MKVTTETRLRRAQRFVDGQTMKEIATSEGVHPSQIGPQLRGVISAAGRRATPGSDLPEGLEWSERTEPKAISRAGRWYVMDNSRVTVEQLRWALLVLDGNERPHACEACGRPL
jgi:hypothetical protein